MKKILLGMISILLGFNFLTYFLSSLFFEFNVTASMIVNCVLVILFFVQTFILSFYISKKFKSVFLPISVLLLFLLLLRLGAVVFQENIFGDIFTIIGWSSFYPIEYILCLILSVGDNFLDAWTIFVFPLIQILPCIIFTTLINKKGEKL